MEPFKIKQVSRASAIFNYKQWNLNIRTIPGATYYSVINTDGRCVAMAIIRRSTGEELGLRMDSKEKPIFMCSAVFVDPKYRHKGIATMLMKHLANSYKDLFLNVDKTNYAGIKTYRKAGFKLQKYNEPNYVMGYLTTPRGYSSLGLSPASDAYLRTLFASYLELEPDLHCTLMYDNNLESNLWGDIPYNTLHKARSVGLKMLGEDSLVLEIYSPTLEERHNDLRSLGYKHSFPEYIQHISLKYGATNSLLDFLNHELETGKLVLPKSLTLTNEQWDILED